MVNARGPDLILPACEGVNLLNNNLAGIPAFLLNKMLDRCQGNILELSIEDVVTAQD